MQLLQRPAVLHELRGQPIQQFRMTGPAAVHAKITGSIDKSHSKVPLPDSINDDSSRQGIPRIGHPRGKLAAAFGIFGAIGQSQFGRLLVNRRQSPRSHGGSG